MIVATVTAPVFQSTLPHGERHTCATLLDGAEVFQSTLPHGERQKIVDRCTERNRISIHAPAWGATRQPHESGRCENFNPRSRMGSDRIAAANARSQGNFNPRSRMGSDEISENATLRKQYFNPRSRMGSDDQFRGVCMTEAVFQSTLPHGERPLRTDNCEGD